MTSNIDLTLYSTKYKIDKLDFPWVKIFQCKTQKRMTRETPNVWDLGRSCNVCIRQSLNGMSERRGRKQYEKIAGNFHNWQKKIKLQIKEDLQKQEGDHKRTSSPSYIIKNCKNQQQTKRLKAEKNKNITLLGKSANFSIEGQ